MTFGGGTPSVHGERHLDAVAAELNNRPRQTLGWQSPLEALTNVLCIESNPLDVR